jgi:hypothetical protein
MMMMILFSIRRRVDTCACNTQRARLVSIWACRYPQIAILEDSITRSIINGLFQHGVDTRAIVSGRQIGAFHHKVFM